MTEQQYREFVQRLCDSAEKSGQLNMAGVARAAGFTPPGLSDFRATGRGGIEKVRELERVLRDRGFGEPEVMGSQKESTAPINAALAAQFESAALVFRSGLPQERKTEFYLSFIATHSKAIEDYRAELEKVADDTGVNREKK